jgi:hypothetical protein
MNKILLHTCTCPAHTNTQSSFYFIFSKHWKIELFAWNKINKKICKHLKWVVLELTDLHSFQWKLKQWNQRSNEKCQFTWFKFIPPLLGMQLCNLHVSQGLSVRLTYIHFHHKFDRGICFPVDTSYFISLAMATCLLICTSTEMPVSECNAVPLTAFSPLKPDA